LTWNQQTLRRCLGLSVAEAASKSCQSFGQRAARTGRKTARFNQNQQSLVKEVVLT
jgi:hypothetical protein